MTVIKGGETSAAEPLLPPCVHVDTPLCHVQEGATATLVVHLSGGAPTSVTWSRGSQDLVVDERYRVAENNNVLQLAVQRSRPEDSGYYSVSAKNAAGESGATLELSVEPGAKRRREDGGEPPPTFLRSLNDLAVKVGTRTRLLVELRGAAKVTWLHDDLDSGDGGGRYTSQHEGNFFCLDVSPVVAEDGGMWTCRAATEGGSEAECSCYLNVLVPKAYKAPEFLEELRALLTEQGTVSLECKVVGVPTPVLRWFKDGHEIKAGDVFALTASMDDPTSLGTYTCEATNCMGKTFSSSRVHVQGQGSSSASSESMYPAGTPPVFVEELNSEKAKLGDAVTLSCRVRVPPWPREVSWYNSHGRVDANLPGGDRYRVQEDGLGKFSLQVTGVELLDQGEVKCVVTSQDGAKAMSRANITVSVPKNYRKPRFLDPLKAILTEEGLVSFECKVVGFPTPQLRWFKDGQELRPGDVYQLSGTNSLGSYSCIAHNCMGEASSGAELTLEDIQGQLSDEERKQLLAANQPPRFVRGLKSAEVKILEPFRFTIQVTVTPEPKVAWYRDDELVESNGKYNTARDNAATYSLTVDKLEIQDQAEWKCIAINDFGQSVTSCFLKLTIPRHFKKPRFLENLRAILSEEGAVNLECKVIGVPQPKLKWYKDGAELKAGDIHRIISGQDGACCLGTYTCEASNCMGTVASSASLLGFEEKVAKNASDVAARKAAQQQLQVLASTGLSAAPPQSGNHRITRDPSLSTIHEERTSQMADHAANDRSLANTIADEDRAEVSFSFDGREVSVSLYETPDLTEEEALQIVEMYAEELSEHVSEHNIVELPSLRFVKESSTSGNLVMEAVVIDVTDENFESALAANNDDERTEDDFDNLSITDDVPEGILPQDKLTSDFLEKAYSTSNREELPKPPPRSKKPLTPTPALEEQIKSSDESYYSLSKKQKMVNEDASESSSAPQNAESLCETFASARTEPLESKKKDEPAFQVAAIEVAKSETSSVKEDSISDKKKTKKVRSRSSSVEKKKKSRVKRSESASSISSRSDKISPASSTSIDGRGLVTLFGRNPTEDEQKQLAILAGTAHECQEIIKLLDLETSKDESQIRSALEEITRGLSYIKAQAVCEINHSNKLEYSILDSLELARDSFNRSTIMVQKTNDSSISSNLLKCLKEFEAGVSNLEQQITLQSTTLGEQTVKEAELSYLDNTCICIKNGLQSLIEQRAKTVTQEKPINSLQVAVLQLQKSLLHLEQDFLKETQNIAYVDGSRSGRSKFYIRSMRMYQLALQTIYQESTGDLLEAKTYVEEGLKALHSINHEDKCIVPYCPLSYVGNDLKSILNEQDLNGKVNLDVVTKEIQNIQQKVNSVGKSHNVEITLSEPAVEKNKITKIKNLVDSSKELQKGLAEIELQTALDFSSQKSLSSGLASSAQKLQKDISDLEKQVKQEKEPSAETITKLVNSAEVFHEELSKTKEAPGLLSKTFNILMETSKEFCHDVAQAVSDIIIEPTVHSMQEEAATAFDTLQRGLTEVAEQLVLEPAIQSHIPKPQHTLQKQLSDEKPLQALAQSTRQLHKAVLEKQSSLESEHGFEVTTMSKTLEECNKTFEYALSLIEEQALCETGSILRTPALSVAVSQCSKDLHDAIQKIEKQASLEKKLSKSDTTYSELQMLADSAKELQIALMQFEQQMPEFLTSDIPECIAQGPYEPYVKKLEKSSSSQENAFIEMLSESAQLLQKELANISKEMSPVSGNVTFNETECVEKLKLLQAKASEFYTGLETIKIQVNDEVESSTITNTFSNSNMVTLEKTKLAFETGLAVIEKQISFECTADISDASYLMYLSNIQALVTATKEFEKGLGFIEEQVIQTIKTSENEEDNSACDVKSCLVEISEIESVSKILNKVQNKLENCNVEGLGHLSESEMDNYKQAQSALQESLKTINEVLQPQHSEQLSLNSASIAKVEKALTDVKRGVSLMEETVVFETLKERNDGSLQQIKDTSLATLTCELKQHVTNIEQQILLDSKAFSSSEGASNASATAFIKMEEHNAKHSHHQLIFDSAQFIQEDSRCLLNANANIEVESSKLHALAAEQTAIDKVLSLSEKTNLVDLKTHAHNIQPVQECVPVSLIQTGIEEAGSLSEKSNLEEKMSGAINLLHVQETHTIMHEEQALEEAGPLKDDSVENLSTRQGILDNVPVAARPIVEEHLIFDLPASLSEVLDNARISCKAQENLNSDLNVAVQSKTFTLEEAHTLSEKSEDGNVLTQGEMHHILHKANPTVSLVQHLEQDSDLLLQHSKYETGIVRTGDIEEVVETCIPAVIDPAETSLSTQSGVSSLETLAHSVREFYRGVAAVQELALLDESVKSLSETDTLTKLKVLGKTAQEFHKGLASVELQKQLENTSELPNLIPEVSFIKETKKAFESGIAVIEQQLILNETEEISSDLLEIKCLEALAKSSREFHKGLQIIEQQPVLDALIGDMSDTEEISKLLNIATSAEVTKYGLAVEEPRIIREQDSKVTTPPSRDIVENEMKSLEMSSSLDDVLSILDDNAHKEDGTQKKFDDKNEQNQTEIDDLDLIKFKINSKTDVFSLIQEELQKQQSSLPESLSSDGKENFDAMKLLEENEDNKARKIRIESLSDALDMPLPDFKKETSSIKSYEKKDISEHIKDVNESGIMKSQENISIEQFKEIKSLIKEDEKVQSISDDVDSKKTVTPKHSLTTQKVDNVTKEIKSEQNRDQFEKESLNTDEKEEVKVEQLTEENIGSIDKDTGKLEKTSLEAESNKSGIWLKREQEDKLKKEAEEKGKLEKEHLEAEAIEMKDKLKREEKYKRESEEKEKLEKESLKAEDKEKETKRKKEEDSNFKKEAEDKERLETVAKEQNAKEKKEKEKKLQKEADEKEKREEELLEAEAKEKEAKRKNEKEEKLKKETEEKELRKAEAKENEVKLKKEKEEKLKKEAEEKEKVEKERLETEAKEKESKLKKEKEAKEKEKLEKEQLEAEAKEKEAKLKKEKEVKLKKEAEEKEKLEKERLEAEAKEKEAKMQKEKEEKLKKEAEEKERLEAEAKEKEAKLKKEKEEKLKKEAEEKEKIEKERLKAEAKEKEAMLKKEKADKLKKEAEEKENLEKKRLETEAKEKEAMLKKEKEEKLKKEAEEKEKLEQERLEAEAKEKEARLKKEKEETLKKEAEEKERLEAEAKEKEAKLKKEREEKSKKEAEEKEKLEKERLKAEAKEKEAKLKEEKLKKEAEEKEKLEKERFEAEAKEKEAKLKKEKADKLKKEAEEKENLEKKRLETEAKEKEAMLKKEKEEKLKREAEEKEKLETERLEAEAKVKEAELKKEKEEKLKKEAEEKERLETEAKEKEAKLKKEKEEKLKKEAEEKEKLQKERLKAEAKEKEAKLKKEKEEILKKEAEEKEKLEKERLESEAKEKEAKLKKEKEEKLKKEAKEKEKLEAEAKVMEAKLQKEKEEKLKKEAEEKEKLEKERFEAEAKEKEAKLKKEKEEKLKKEAKEKEKLEKERLEAETKKKEAKLKKEKEEKLRKEAEEKEKREKERLEAEAKEKEAKLKKEKEEILKKEAEEKEKLEKERLESEAKEKEAKLKKEKEEKLKKEAKEKEKLEAEAKVKEAKLQKEKEEKLKKEAEEKERLETEAKEKEAKLKKEKEEKLKKEAEEKEKLEKERLKSEAKEKEAKLKKEKEEILKKEAEEKEKLEKERLEAEAKEKEAKLKKEKEEKLKKEAKEKEKLEAKENEAKLKKEKEEKLKKEAEEKENLEKKRLEIEAKEKEAKLKKEKEEKLKKEAEEEEKLEKERLEAEAKETEAILKKEKEEMLKKEAEEKEKRENEQLEAEAKVKEAKLKKEKEEKLKKEKLEKERLEAEAKEKEIVEKERLEAEAKEKESKLKKEKEEKLRKEAEEKEELEKKRLDAEAKEKEVKLKKEKEEKLRKEAEEKEKLEKERLDAEAKEKEAKLKKEKEEKLKKDAEEKERIEAEAKEKEAKLKKKKEDTLKKEAAEKEKLEAEAKTKESKLKKEKSNKEVEKKKSNDSDARENAELQKNETEVIDKKDKRKKETSIKKTKEQSKPEIDLKSKSENVDKEVQEGNVNISNIDDVSNNGLNNNSLETNKRISLKKKLNKSLSSEFKHGNIEVENENSVQSSLSTIKKTTETHSVINAEKTVEMVDSKIKTDITSETSHLRRTRARQSSIDELSSDSESQSKLSYVATAATTHIDRRNRDENITLSENTESTKSSRRRGQQTLRGKKPHFCSRLTDRTAQEGSKVKFTCSVLGNPEPLIQWHLGDITIRSDKSRAISCINGLASLEIHAAKLEDCGEYSCSATNELGESSTSAILRVYEGYEPEPWVPTFTRSIKDVYHSSADELVLECRLRSQQAPHVIWMKDGLPLAGSPRFLQEVITDPLGGGALSCRLVISHPIAVDSGHYICRAETNAWSDHISADVIFKGRERSVRQSTSSLCLSDEGSLSLPEGKPFITSGLKDYEVPLGGTIALQVEVKGSPKPDVVWLHEDNPLPHTPKVRTHHERGVFTLTVVNASPLEAGLYTCRAFNAFGRADSRATVRVVARGGRTDKPAIFVERPETTLGVALGEDITISFRVAGEPRPQVTWMKGTRDITTSARVMKETVNDYVRLTLKRALAGDAGTYCVLARNVYGVDRSFVTVRIRQRARSLTPTPDVTPTETAILLRDIRDQKEERALRDVPGPISSEPQVTESGRSWLTLSWRKPHVGGAPVVAYRVDAWLVGGGATWDEIGVTPINSFDAFSLKPGGEYKFRVTPRNRYGWGESVVTTDTFVVGKRVELPEFVRILPGQQKVLKSSDVTLECEVRAQPSPEVRWCRDGAPVECSERITMHYDGAKCSLILRNVQESDTGRYMCEASNPAGRVSTFARLLVVSDQKILEADCKLRKGLLEDSPATESAPHFSMRLRDRRVQVTYPVRLTCQVTGQPTPIVTWLKDGEPIKLGERATASTSELFHTLELTNAREDDSGLYTACARNPLGSVSCRCRLVVDKGIRAYIAPVFIFGLEHVECKEGGEIRLLAQVEAYPTVAITWHRDGVRLRPCRRTEMTLDHEGNVELVVSGATSKDAGVYSCSATNEVGRTESSSKVEVFSAAQALPQVAITQLYSKEPRFVTKPRSTEAVEGDTVIILCEVIGDPKPEVMWLRDWLRPDYYRDAPHFIRVGDGPEYRLEIPCAKLDYTGAYSVIARNTHGEAKAIISLQILAKGLEDPVREHRPVTHSNIQTLPSITRPLKDRRCCDGDSVTFECGVTAIPDPDVRWEKDGRLLPLGGDMLAECDGSTARLTIQQVYPEDEGEYACVAYNELGRSSTAACLIVDVPEEKEALLSGQLSRPPGLLSAGSTPRSTPRTTPSRSKSPSLTRHRARSTTEPSECRRPRLKVAPPKFYAIPHNKVVEEGATVRFQCAIAGHPPPWVTWDKDGLLVTPSRRFTIKEKDDLRILEISEVTVEDAGLYRITLENDVGRVEASARLDVIGPVGSRRSIRAWSASPRTSPCFGRRFAHTTGRYGGRVTLACDIRGSPSPVPAWYKDGLQLMATERISASFDGCCARLTLDALRACDAGEYTCEARNEEGTARCSARLEVEPADIPAPNFAPGLSDLSASDGHPLELHVRLQGGDTRHMEVIWLRQGRRLPDCRDFRYLTLGEGRYALRIADVFPQDAGVFTCEARGTFGTITSSAKLTVIETKKVSSEDSPKNGVNGVAHKARSASPARVLIGPTDTIALRGDCVSLRAKYAGFPEPTVRWLRAGREVVPVAGRVAITTKEGETTLTLSSITADDSGKYVVAATNEHASHCHFASLAVEGPPDPPSGRPSVVVSGNTAVLAWGSAPYDGGCKVSSYRVEIRTLGGEWTAAADGVTSLSHTIKDLITGLQYVVRVCAGNVHGFSDPGSESAPFTPNDIDILGRDGDSDEEEPEDEVFAGPVKVEKAETDLSSRYIVHEELGKGRFGVVFRATHVLSGQRRAAKFVRCIKAKDREKVYEEIDIMNVLRHPKLLQLEAAFESSKEIILMMEYISGGELFERVVADDFTLTERDCILFMRQICEGVKYMHSQDVVHLDLKPENIMCRTRTSHHIKLIDFGLAKRLHGDEPVRVLFGTPEFVPPEVINYEPISVASDMWSVGVICYVLLSGLSPFMGDNDAETFANTTRADFDFDDEAFDAISQDAKDFISSLLVQRKEKRMTAGECLGHKWLAQHDHSMQTVKLSTDKLKKFIIRRKWQKTGNAIRALGRMASLSARRNTSPAPSRPAPCARLASLNEEHALEHTMDMNGSHAHSPDLRKVRMFSERSDSGFSETSQPPSRQESIDVGCSVFKNARMNPLSLDKQHPEEICTTNNNHQVLKTILKH